MLACAASAAQSDAVHRGACDASAVVLLDEEHIVVASDEDNQLRVYATGGGAALGALDLNRHLGIAAGDEHGEADLEGAAVLGGKIYWIGSHGRNRKGKLRRQRHQLFATSFEREGDSWQGQPFGRVYTGLADDLSRHEKLVGLGLDEAIRADLRSGVEQLAPTDSGLNIEGLAATPDGALLIGLRNPLDAQHRAILIVLRNPEAVVGDGAAPRYGAPIFLDLDGLGVRSIEPIPGDAGAYYLLAGPKTGGPIALYRWSGAESDTPTRLGPIHGLKAEGLFPSATGSWLQLVSDDGTLRVGGVECKKAEPARRSFRSRRLDLDPAWGQE